jgi:xanthine/uracil permease
MMSLGRGYAGSALTVLLATLLGSLLWWAGDPTTLAVGIGVMLLAGLDRRRVAATAARVAPVHSAAIRRRRQAWSLVPMPLLDPGLPGRPTVRRR